MRKSLSKRIRFEVLKRDSFTCVYCGKNPSQEVLEVDHVIPVSKGGKNTTENLVTSCFSCNRGKSNIELTSLPESVINENNLIRIQQYKQYVKYIKNLHALDNQLIDIVCDVYTSYNVEYTPSDSFRNDILKFIKRIGIDDTTQAMRTACSRMDRRDIPRYFFGICWNIAKNR